MSTKPVGGPSNRIRALQQKVDQLQSDVRLTNLRDAVEDVGSTASGLVERVRSLRARGYVFEKSLEGKAADLEGQWSPLRSRVLGQIDQEAAGLQRDLASVEQLVRQVGAPAGTPPAAPPLLGQAERAAEALEGKAEAAERSIRGMYDQYQGEVNQLMQHLRRVEWMLTQFAEATFRLLPTEGGIMAVRATWQKGGKDDPTGILYLTDQRLLFEQKQEIATKKMLFITTEKEKIQELLFEVPVGQIEKVQASKKGLLRHEDHLDLDLAAGGALSSAHFHIDGQRSKTWQGLIGSAMSGDFDRDRAVAVDQKAAEKVRTAPTRCPNCNAPITQQILRGMDRITCEYCGHVIRL